MALPSQKVQPVIALFDSLNDIILKMVDYIILFAPWGVAALMSGLVTDFQGDTSIFSALAVYALTVVVALFILLLVFYPALIHFFSRISPKKFIRAMYPVPVSYTQLWRTTPFGLFSTTSGRTSEPEIRSTGKSDASGTEH